MPAPRLHHLPVILLSALFASILPAAPLGDPPTIPPEPAAQPEPVPAPRPPSDTTYPQIVRIRYLEGDVHVARGAQDEKATGATWEQAVANLPLETGFSLVTGAGQAEIEFEDASTLYLADNSVLTLDDLHTTRGIPHTDLTLLSGTATVHFYPIYNGQSYLLRTPTDSIATTYPEKSYIRVDSYLDAVAVTPLVALAPEKHLTLRVSGAPTSTAARGQTVFYDHGAPVTPPPAVDANASAQWDKWVASRVVSRAAAMDAVSKASGLPTSMPGLGDMAAQGTFFPCTPYGTCWAPAAADAQPPAPASAQPISAPDFALTLSRTSVNVTPGSRTKVSLTAIPIAAFTGNITLASTLPPGFSCVASCAGPIALSTPLPLELYVDASVAPGDYTVLFTADSAPDTGAIEHQATLLVHVFSAPVAEFEIPAAATVFPYFPCAPAGVHALAIRDRIHPRVVNLSLGLGVPPYAWAVCHAGTWIYHQHGYIWVAGKKRHHHPPICWIRHERKFAYVPRHPRDLPGQPPHNRTHEVYLAGDRKDDPFQPAELPPNSKIETLNRPPTDFRAPALPPLARAPDPILAAHKLKDAPAQPGLALQFDHKKQSFLLISKVTEDSKVRTVSTPFASHVSTLHANSGSLERRGSNARPASTTPTHPASTGPHASPAVHASAPSHSAAASHPAAASHSSTGASHTTSTHH